MIIGSGFVGCCGISILYGLQQKVSYFTEGQKKQDIFELFKNTKDQKYKVGMTIVALAEHQFPWYEDEICRMEYQRIFEVVNPNTGNIVRLYAINHGHIKRPEINLTEII